MGELIQRNFDNERSVRGDVPEVVFDMFGRVWHVEPIEDSDQIEYAAMMAEPAEARGPFAAKAVRDMLDKLVRADELIEWHSIWRKGLPEERDGEGNVTRPRVYGLDLPEMNKLLAWVMEQFSKGRPSTPSAV
jgi:hypothetical protein